MFKCFPLNHSSVALAVCLGSLSCWKVNLHPSLKSLEDRNRFPSRIIYLTAITHLGLDKYFFLQQARRTGHSPNTRQGRQPSYLQEEVTQVQRTQSRESYKDPQKASGKAAIITRQHANIGQ